MEAHDTVGLVGRTLRGVAAVVLLTGCGGALETTGVAPSGRQDLPGVEVLQHAWTLVSLQDAEGPLETVPAGGFVADFGVDGDLYIEADCNVCSGAYRAGDEGALEVIGPIPCTLAYCSTAPLDTRFLRALQAARTWSIDDGTLQLSSPDGGTLLLHRRD
jgi:heat shock protein HslJ